MKRREFFQLLITEGKLVPEKLKADPYYEIAKKVIAQKENISLLEEILIQSSREHELAKKGKFNPPLSSEELGEKFAKVKSRIHSFLKIPEIDGHYETLVLSEEEKEKLYKRYTKHYPAIILAGSITIGYSLSYRFLQRRRALQLILPLIISGALGIGAKQAAKLFLQQFYRKAASAHYNFYINPVNTICIKETHEETQIGSLAHEYAHFLQDSFDMLQESIFIPLQHLLERNKSHIVCEGHARGVAYNILREVVEETGNYAYLYKTSALHIDNIYHAYYWGHRLNNIEPNIKRDIEGSLNEYALGTALF
ncbi:hypothetical protein HY501_02495, partial [Candidatus Woesearchaeota archaeon]|nr:hypothetical protein [Candidatus Woesearchaeota archaeon]